MMNDYTFTGPRIGHISYSQIELFECPYKYLRLYLRRDIPNDTVPMRMGSFVHEFITRYTEACLKLKVKSDYDEAIKAFVDTKVDLEPEDLAECRKICLDFAEKEIPFNIILDHEHEKMIEIDQGVWIKCILDRVNKYLDSESNGNTILEVLDFKNSRSIPSKTAVSENKQLKIYRYLANLIYPGNDFIRSGISLPRYGGHTVWTDLVPVSDCAVEFDNTRSFLIDTYHKIMSTTEFAPKQCGACWIYGGCSVLLARQCPLYQDMTKLSTGPLEDRIRALRVLDMNRSKLLAEVKEIVNESPDKQLNIDGIKVGYKPSQKITYDLDDIQDYCSRHGFDLPPISVAKTVAEKNIKPDRLNKHMFADLESIRKKKMSTIFFY